MADSNQLQAEQNTTTIDRISDLPDSILCHILSFIPTLTAVTTSLLSRRWRHLWKYLQVFSFHDPSETPQDVDVTYDDDPFGTLDGFVGFVNTVLALRRSPDIREFRLSCGYWFAVTIFTADCVNKWIRDAIGPHLQELHFSIDDSPNADIFTLLPLSVFTCSGLVTLSLMGAICVEKLSTVHLPSLKTLQLCIDRGPINMLLSGCPVLETLSLYLRTRRRHGTGKFGKIRMPSSLKRLVLLDERDLEIEDLEIDTPSLEYLGIKIRTKCSHFSFKNLQNVVRAYLDFSTPDNYTDFMLKLLGALTRTKYLVMNLPTISTELLDLPKFGFLLHLSVSVPHVNLEFMVNLLKNCDMLHVLRIQKRVFGEEPFSVESWTQPISEPNCLRSHLINFEFQGYQGFACEKAFITYILQRGLVLKTVKIHANNIPTLLHFEQRGSNTCHVNFI